MIKEEQYVLKRLQEKIDQFELQENVDEIKKSKNKWSGEFIETTYNDGTIELVDPLTEFYLCKKHFLYFADNYGQILDVKNKRIFKFKALPFQKKLILPALENNRFVIFRKSRQVGASVISGIYALWKINFNIAQLVIVISKIRKDAQEFKEKAMVTYDRLPTFLKSKPTRDGQNMTTLKLVNNSRLEVRSQSPDAGRGSTASLVILDEAAFMPYADEIWSAVLPALSNSDGQCFIISTSNGVGNFYHQMWTKAEDDNSEFFPLYIPWWKFPGRSNPWLDRIDNHDVVYLENDLGITEVQTIKKELTIDILKSGKGIYWKLLIDAFIKKKEEEALNYNGPKKEKPWLKQMFDAMNDVRKFNQEILSRFLGSGNTVISVGALERIEKMIREPIVSNELLHEEMKGLEIYQGPVDDITYSMFSDVSSGAGQDYNTMQIFRDDTLEQVAEYKRMIDTKAFGTNIKKVAKYYNFAYVVIETNQGMSVFNEVYLHDTEPYQNVFYEFKGKAYRGLHTGPYNKKLMLDEFMYNIENDIIKIYGKRTLDELKVYIWHNGKPVASRGYNDDLVLPLLFLSYLAKYGNDHTKLLGFATSTQTVGMEKDKEEELKEETDYLREESAKKAVQESYGIEWDFYKEIVR